MKPAKTNEEAAAGHLGTYIANQAMLHTLLAAIAELQPADKKPGFYDRMLKRALKLAAAFPLGPDIIHPEIVRERAKIAIEEVMEVSLN